MNLARLFPGCLKAFSRATDWPQYFDLSEKGFRGSFWALILSMPVLYVGYAAIVKQRQTLLASQPELVDTLPTLVSPPMMFLLLIIYFMMFPICAYILCLVFDKMDRFRAWVIVRLWTFFFIYLGTGLLLGLNLLGVLSFSFVMVPVFILYMGTLVVDIRYAQKIAGFEWGAAILAACIFSAMGLTVMLTGSAALA